MAVNNPQGHNQYTDKKKSDSGDSESKRSASGTRGSGSEQHAQAGRQSHKNDDRSSGSSSGSSKAQK